MTPPSEGRFCGPRAKFITKLRQRHFDGAGRATPGILQQPDPPAGGGRGSGAPQADILDAKRDRKSAAPLANVLVRSVRRAAVALPIGDTGCQNQVDR